MEALTTATVTTVRSEAQAESLDQGFFFFGFFLSWFTFAALAEKIQISARLQPSVPPLGGANRCNRVDLKLQVLTSPAGMFRLAHTLFNFLLSVTSEAFGRLEVP